MRPPRTRARAFARRIPITRRTHPRAQRSAGRARRRDSIAMNPPLRRVRPPAVVASARTTGGPRARPRHMASTPVGSPADARPAPLVTLGSPVSQSPRDSAPLGAASARLSQRGRRSGGDTREDHRPCAEIRRRPPRRQTQGERARPALRSVDTVSSADCVTGDHGSLAPGAPPRTDGAVRIEPRTIVGSAAVSSRYLESGYGRCR